MIDLKTHEIFSEYMPDGRLFYNLYIPKKIISQLEKDLFFTSKTKYAVDDPYITFNLSQEQLQEIYLYRTDIDDKHTYTNIFFIFHKRGLDALVKTIGKDTLIFPIFEITKSIKINKNFFKELFSKKINKKVDKDFDGIEVVYSGSYSFYYNNLEYKEAIFKIYIEPSLTRRLLEFYDEIKTNWKNIALSKYNNLVIYFNKDNIDNNILFDIDNFDKIEKLNLNLIQNRLFYISGNAKKCNLYMNNLYLTSLEKNDKLNLSCEKSLKPEVEFIKDDNALKLSNKFLI